MPSRVSVPCAPGSLLHQLGIVEASQVSIPADAEELLGALTSELSITAYNTASSSDVTTHYPIGFGPVRVIEAVHLLNCMHVSWKQRNLSPAEMSDGKKGVSCKWDTQEYTLHLYSEEPDSWPLRLMQTASQHATPTLSNKLCLSVYTFSDNGRMQHKLCLQIQTKMTEHEQCLVVHFGQVNLDQGKTRVQFSEHFEADTDSCECPMCTFTRGEREYKVTHLDLCTWTHTIDPLLHTSTAATEESFPRCVSSQEVNSPLRSEPDDSFSLFTPSDNTAPGKETSTVQPCHARDDSICQEIGSSTVANEIRDAEPLRKKVRKLDFNAKLAILAEIERDVKQQVDNQYNHLNLRRAKLEADVKQAESAVETAKDSHASIRQSLKTASDIRDKTHSELSILNESKKELEAKQLAMKRAVDDRKHTIAQLVSAIEDHKLKLKKEKETHSQSIQEYTVMLEQLTQGNAKLVIQTNEVNSLTSQVQEARTGEDECTTAMMKARELLSSFEQSDLAPFEQTHQRFLVAE